MLRFQRGEGEAFEVLLDRYAKHVVNFASRFFSEASDADDVAQEILLRVYTKKDRYSAGRPFRPWFFSIAGRLVSNRLRELRRHPVLPVETPIETEADDGRIEHADPKDVDPLLIAERAERRHDIEGALEALPESQRVAVILSRFEEMSYEEIAQTMGLSLTAVKSLLFRARNRLTQLLSRYA